MDSESIEGRSRYTDEILVKLQRLVGETLPPALDSDITIFACGSAGRGDMGPHSDLDPYVVDFAEGLDGTQSEARAAKVASVLERAVLKAGLPALDNHGSYARSVSANRLFQHFGAPEDDSTGSFTKRLLLLLESRPLINDARYSALVDRAIETYWKNETAHPTDYLPLVLVNDIVRYWRTLLLNHESRLASRRGKQPMTEADELAWRRYSSYKLRVPRCLTCFSALTYLLALAPTEPAHIGREHAKTMIGLRPLQRLRAVPVLSESECAKALVEQLEAVYSRYLERTSAQGSDLLAKLATDTALAQALSKDGGDFTRLMFLLVQEVGGGRLLHRHIVV